MYVCIKVAASFESKSSLSVSAAGCVTRALAPLARSRRKTHRSFALSPNRKRIFPLFAFAIIFISRPSPKSHFLIFCH